MNGPMAGVAAAGQIARPRSPAFAIGVGVCAAIAILAFGFARLAAVPAVLTALIVGMAARRWYTPESGTAGIDFCARTLLHAGVALIGVRLSLDQVTGLGWHAASIAVGAVVVTLVGGAAIGRAFGLSPARAVLSAGSVGICGASAALAISSVLPQTPQLQRETVFTIAAVTTLSTIVMIAYPLLGRVVGFDETQAGIFFGAAIHDVTQVIGAGALVSPEATTAATATKLIRVACLAPATALIALWAARARRGESMTSAPPILPPFLIGFVAMAIAANSGWFAEGILVFLSEAATFCLVAATAALGMKTSLRELAGAGWCPLAAMTTQTALIGTYALGAVWWVTSTG